MANAANTAWKLTDMWNETLFEFDSASGWHPTNENQTPALTGDYYDVPYYNVAQNIDFGLGGRQITLQGVDVADKDVWLLSSVICKRQLMKLWCGEDWFYYVLGREMRQIRDETLPGQKSYTVGLVAMDPHYYFSNSPGGSGSGKNFVVPSASVGSVWVLDGATYASNVYLDLSGSGADEGTTDVEPMFWIVGGTSTNISKIRIWDYHQLGVKLEYSPISAITDGDVHVIMPYRNTVYEGFMTEDATGFKVKDGTGSSYVTEPDGTMGGSVSAVGTWAMDAFNVGAGTDVGISGAGNTHNIVEEETPCSLSMSGPFIPKNRQYPRMPDGLNRKCRIWVMTGTYTDCKVFAQWCVRRV